MEKNNLLYIGIQLDEQSKEKLIKFGDEYIRLYSKYICEWNPKFICHHMTVSFITKLNDEVKQWSKMNDGKNFSLKGVKFGMSNKACALMVEVNAPTTSEVKHITIATNMSENGKPVDSNYITDWMDIEPIVLNGTLTFYYKN